jgi:hypothetical protein
MAFFQESGRISRLEMLMRELKQNLTFAGSSTPRRGKCTMICKVLISIHSFFSERPRKSCRKKLRLRLAVIVVLVFDPALRSILVSSIDHC